MNLLLSRIKVDIKQKVSIPPFLHLIKRIASEVPDIQEYTCHFISQLDEQICKKKAKKLISGVFHKEAISITNLYFTSPFSIRS